MTDDSSIPAPAAPPPASSGGERLLVCGGRGYADVALLWRMLDELRATLPEPGILLVIDGASDDVTGPYVGADYWGNQWALARGIPTIRQHADWKGKGKAAGPIRNGEMIELHMPTLVVAFPGGGGTADMIKQAKMADIPVTEIAS